MSSPARVTSIEAVREFKAALLTFEQEATASLESIQLLLHRVVGWVEHDCPAYWDSQVKRAFDKVAETRTQLATCQMRTVAGRHPACIEEKQAYDKAQRRLEYCQGMVLQVKHWNVKIRHEADEYRGRTAGLTRCVANDLPSMAALIERTATALEAYAEISTAPSEPEHQRATPSATGTTASASPADGGLTPENPE